MIEEQKPIVLGIGSALMDLLINVNDDFLNHYLQISGTIKGGRHLLSEVEMQNLYCQFSQLPMVVSGGSAANTLAGLAKLGVATRMIGKVGEDVQGAQFVQDLSAQNVDVSKIKYYKGIGTGSCISMITPDGERTMRTFLGASGELEKKEIVSEDFADCSLVKLEAYLVNEKGFLQHCFELAKQHNCKVLFDLASIEIVEKYRIKIMKLLNDYQPIILANEEEALALTKATTAEVALQKMKDYSPIPMITLGKKGALLSANDEDVWVPAREVKAIDTTGAGDLFSVGFIFGFLSGWSLEDTGRLACAVASLAVQQYGARIPEQIWDDLRLEFLI